MAEQRTARTGWCELEKALPVEQRDQLAELILARLEAGWGEVVIEFKDHHILSFREINSIAAKKKQARTETMT